MLAGNIGLVLQNVIVRAKSNDQKGNQKTLSFRGTSVVALAFLSSVLVRVFKERFQSIGLWGCEFEFTSRQPA